MGSAKPGRPQLDNASGTREFRVGCADEQLTDTAPAGRLAPRLGTLGKVD